MANIAAVQRLFLSSPYYAVIGASKDQSKFGTKILNWYKTRNMDVQPIHHKETHLEGLETIPSVAELRSPTQTSISIITPPKVTLGLLQAAMPLGVPAVWIQPGAADEGVAAWVKENGMEHRVIYGGPCILVEGDGIRSLL
ncbi:NAD-P-binding protein [Mycena galopus ATCC 62051]|nr:NAD-P-binding protein [Mycena galopus ATCC 62051]